MPRPSQDLFVSCCPVCVEGKPRKTITAGHTPILTKGFGTRGQVDLIDFQSTPDGEFKYLLNYQVGVPLVVVCNVELTLVWIFMFANRACSGLQITCD